MRRLPDDRHTVYDFAQAVAMEGGMLYEIATEFDVDMSELKSMVRQLACERIADHTVHYLNKDWRMKVLGLLAADAEDRAHLEQLGDIDIDEHRGETWEAINKDLLQKYEKALNE